MTGERGLLLATLLMAVAFPLSMLLGGPSDRRGGTTPLPVPLREAIPSELAGWTGIAEDDLGERALEMTGVDDYVSRRYRNAAGDEVVLYVAYHGNKERGIGSLYHNASVCYPAAGWRLANETFDSVVLGTSARVVPTCRYLFVREGGALSVLTFFSVDGELLDQSPRNKPFWLLTDRLAPDIDDDPGTFVQVQLVAGVDDRGEAEIARVQREFLQVFGAAIFRAVP